MREPGEDAGGEYWQLTPPPQEHPLNVCACPKPEGCYGTRGWHFNAAGAAVGRCPAYSAAVERSGGTVKAGHGKRRRGGST